MKKLIAILMLMASMVPALRAAEEVDYSPFDYQGFRMDLPMNTSVEMTSKEAVLKNPELGVGFSLKLEKDAKADADRAYKLCEALVKDMDVKSAADVQRVTIAGLKGAMTTGSIEGANLSLLVLSTGDGYLKLVGISSPDQAAIVAHVIGSLTRP